MPIVSMVCSKMDITNFTKAIKQLIKVTTKKRWTNTINVILVALHIRNMYYMDIDDVYFTSASEKYQAAFLKVCEIANLNLILFDNGRWIVHNDKVNNKQLGSHRGIGKALDFPCSEKAMYIKDEKERLGVDFIIGTEYGKITVTSFWCHKKEKQNVIRWLNKKKDGLLMLKSLNIFRDLQPYIEFDFKEKYILQL